MRLGVAVDADHAIGPRGQQPPRIAAGAEGAVEPGPPDRRAGRKQRRQQHRHMGGGALAERHAQRAPARASAVIGLKGLSRPARKARIFEATSTS